MTCAVAGSDLLPNSSRSPPAQKAFPSPRSSTRATSLVAAANVSASFSSSRIARVESIHPFRDGSA